MAETLTNQQWLYVQRPDGRVGAKHYRLHTEALLPALAEGEVLLASRYISVDPYMRIQQSSGKTWEAPHPLGTVQGAGVVGQVLASRYPGLNEGDWVQAYSGWQRFAKLHGSALTRLDPDVAPVTTALHVLGMPGRTAWFGLMEAGQPKPGETVVVSGAAGAVGSLVVQFAKKAGCRVVAIAGSAEKLRWLRDELRADQVLNYRELADANALASALDALNVKVDIYFDNVGGWISDAVLSRINLRGRMIICGQMSQYQGGLDKPEYGPRLLHHLLFQRARIEGILARDFSHRMPEMVARVAPWLRDGSLKYRETIREGFELLPRALAELFDSTGSGKVLVKV